MWVERKRVVTFPERKKTSVTEKINWRKKKERKRKEKDGKSLTEKKDLRKRKGKDKKEKPKDNMN